ncbi:putative Cytochrome P450 [Seiridium cardinale]|uniref:Cytochrome P450 n=1 Tax=Seiridium cardinale TaxID=138064 RepID=A0ABR2XDG0_9PEZI
MASYVLTSGNVFATLVASWLAYFISNVRLPWILKFTKGVLPFYMAVLHKKYGDIFRVAPDELAFANPAAWNDIQGHRSKGQLETEKSAKFYRPIKGVTTGIITADRQSMGSCGGRWPMASARRLSVTGNP